MTINTDNELLKAIRSGKEKDKKIAELEEAIRNVLEYYPELESLKKALEGK